MKKKKKSRHALLTHKIILTVCPPKKLKVVCMKIDQTPEEELAGVCVISFRTDSIRFMEYTEKN